MSHTCGPRVAMVALAACFLAGCPEGVGNLVETKGKVSYNGAPLEGATVFFSSSAHSALATTDAKGEFTLMTGNQTGAVPGKYKVTVNKSAAATAGSTPSPTGGGPLVTAQPGQPAPSPAEIQAKMQAEQNAAAAAQPKALVPVKYTQAGTTPLEYEVTSDAAKNVFDIVLTD